MRRLEIKNRTVFETVLVIPEGYTPFGISIWCATYLSKKLDLDFEHGVAQFMNEEDALKFEKEWVNNG